ncbi:MAG: ACT domain-containing protein [Oscillospiraceae bacterium]|nr:ACT domain-containing protein [Oscillospiraceae bacterium]
MKIKKLEYDFSVCKVDDVSAVNLRDNFVFLGKTDDEISLVCQTSRVPLSAIERNDGWKAFKIEDILDFSLVGILSKIATLFADNHISIFAISTFNTDYILIKAAEYEKASALLAQAGYQIV